MKISVIIPTFNRLEGLKKSLASLFNQSLADSEYEILVVIDGSTDGTKEFLSGFCVEHENLVFFEQKNKGAAAARNVGIKNARGEYLFFTGDDIIASADLLKEHLKALEAHQGCAVLGLTLWDDSIVVSGFMEFLMSAGHQFKYGGLTDGEYCPWGLFYTSNISLERSWLEEELFDEEFFYPAWDDCELGYRLTKRGLKIIFLKKALAFHRHVISEEGFYNKVKQSGFSRVRFYKKHPELVTVGFLLARSALFLYIFKALSCFGWALKFVRLYKLNWQFKIWYYTALGIRQGLKIGRFTKAPTA